MIEAGNVLNGRYKLLRPLGQGSQAFVWVAEHLALGSQVAVKLIDPELAKQDDARERFAREATAAAKLRSAHVVHILDHGIDQEQPFIVMELLEGEDLFDRLERRRRLTLAETSKIVTQVARALMRAHAEGIIHRDLKPENVFLVRNEDDELAKVLDFGVAKITTPAKAVMVRTGVGTLIGTPHYMSPEQVKGLTEIDHRSDLWSLAVIAYQCVTGQLPFDSEGVGDLLIRITMSTPPTPSTINPELPPAFDEWFKKAAAKEPDDRFETARDMADALAKAVGAPMMPVSQPGRVLVNLADSPDLDWGSLAGVRIPIPPRKSAPPAALPNAGIQFGKAKKPAPPHASTKASSRLPTLDASEPEEAELLEEEAEEIEPESAPPSSAGAAAAAPKPDSDRPPPSSRGAPPSARAPISANPFLQGAASQPDSGRTGSGPPPSSQSGVAVGRGHIGRHLQTTVTGLASTSQPAPPDLEPELNPRKRRATWLVAGAVCVAAVAIGFTVVRSRGGLSGLTGPAGAQTSTEPTSGGATSTSTARGLGVPPPVLTASSTVGSSSSEAKDPTVTRTPVSASASVAPTVRGPRPGPRPTADEIQIEIPDPNRPVIIPGKRFPSNND